MKNLFVVALGMALLVSCEHQKEGTIQLVLDWSINTNHTGAFVAQKLGYFTEQGLVVNILTPPETGAVGALLSGKAQFIYSYQEEVTLAGAAGQDILAVAGVIQNNTSGFAAPKDRHITRPRDFEGKTYGGWGSPMEEAVLRALMEKDGGDFSRLNIVNMGTMDYFMAVEKSIDFAWIFQGWTGVEAQLRNMPLDYIDVGALNPALNYYTPVIAGQGEWLSKNPELAKKFLAALKKGYEYAMANPEKSAQILLEAAPELSPELVRGSQGYLSKAYAPEGTTWGVMDLKRWVDFSDWLAGQGLLPTPRTPSQLFTNAYLP